MKLETNVMKILYVKMSRANNLFQKPFCFKNKVNL